MNSGQKMRDSRALRGLWAGSEGATLRTTNQDGYEVYVYVNFM